MRLIEFADADKTGLWVALNVEMISAVKPDPDNANTQTVLTVDQMDYIVIGAYTDVLIKMGWVYGRSAEMQDVINKGMNTDVS